MNGTPSARPRRITSDLSMSVNGASMAIGAASPTDNAPAIRSKNSGVASGERIAGKRTNHDPSDAGARHEDRGLREQHDVTPLEVDVLVGRVVRRRFPADRPMSRRVHIAHVDRQADESQHVRAGNGPEFEQPLCHRTLFSLPRRGRRPHRPAEPTAGLSRAAWARSTALSRPAERGPATPSFVMDK